MKEKSYEDVKQYAEMICKRYDWKLTDDEEMLESLISGLQTNFNRLGYFNCPCRDNQADAKLDKDIICPCLYAREHDVDQHGYCFCALFFRQDFDTSKPFQQIPERRPATLSRAGEE